jgi:fatty acid desaturase
MDLKFTPRQQLAEYEWDAVKQTWQRLPLDRDILNRLSERSNLHAVLRVTGLTVLLCGLAAATVYTARFSLLLAIPVLFAYYFIYGFLVALAHELQHKLVFARSLDKISEVIYYIVQTLIWNSPRYARISHRLHHRYTMVEGLDPETDWPAVITSSWLKAYLRGLISKILVYGAIHDLYATILVQIRRVAGIKDRMMREHCSEDDLKVIRIESGLILLAHVAIVAGAIWFRRWEPIVFVTIAWQIGSGIEGLWHQTEHISRMRNVNDQRLCTRSVHVGPFIRLIYGGLDDHVDHHLFPGVPSRNLPALHRVLAKDLAKPQGVIDCWREMLAVAREKDQHPDHEYLPVMKNGGDETPPTLVH